MTRRASRPAFNNYAPSNNFFCFSSMNLCFLFLLAFCFPKITYLPLALFSYCWFNLFSCWYQFYDIIWEKVRETVEVGVIRESSAARLILKVFVDETSSDEVNR